MNKIKTLIVNDNEKVINEIKEALSPIEYVEVVGECKKGEETFEKVVELKPNAVFVKYGMKGYNPIDVMIKSSKILGKETPMFKFVSNELLGESSNKTYADKEKDERDKLIHKNSKPKNENYVTVRELNKDGIINVLQEYYNEVFKG